MKTLRLPYLLTMVVLASAVHGQVVVSPSGNDGSPGTSERPVASLNRAIELSRSTTNRTVRSIVVKAGRYFDVAITLTREDSNLTIESEPGKPAILFGGVPLKGWEKDGDRFWSAVLPTGRAWDVRLLQVNGRFCPRARFPEKGTLTHQTVFNVPWMSTTGGGWKRPPTHEELTTLQYAEGDFPAGMDLKGAEITVFHMWDESVSGIESMDTAAKTLRLNPPLGHPPGAFDVKTYCLWNLKEGMTQPGQWYFDRGRNRIVYWPLPGEDISKSEVVVPTRQTVLRLDGATNVNVRNLEVAVTTVPLITGGFAAGAFDGAIQLRNANSVRLTGIRIHNLAGHAIKTDGRSSNIEIANGDIFNCGAGGVYLNGSSNVVRNCLIHDVGLMFPSAIGINGDGSHSSLSCNEVYDTSYSAIAFGVKDSVIESNLLHHCMKVLHDGAAIYVFAGRNSSIRGNFVRDIVDTGGYGASSYYLDEQTRECVVESNISLNVARPSHNHMATNNVIRNNVFITHGDMKLTFPRSTEFVMEGNVLYATGSVTFEGINNVARWSRNLVYSGSAKIEGLTLKDYATAEKGTGICGDTQAGDPLFVALDKLDLHYKPESPALKLGLRPLDVFQGGRR